MSAFSKLFGRTPPERKKTEIDISQSPANAETVDALFQLILGRAIDDAPFKAAHDGTQPIHYWIERLIDSAEFRNHFLKKHGATLPSPQYIPDASYRAPTVGAHALPGLVLVTGSCLTDLWKTTIESAHPGIEIRHQVFYNGSTLEDLPDAELARAAFQVVQFPLRAILPEKDYFSNTLSDEGLAAIEKTFQACVERLRRNLSAALKYNRAMGMPVFVLNFAVPQANPLGFLLPKYELSNFSHFVRELNRALHDLLALEKSAYVIDFDEITATLGKRFTQDDLVNHANHGSFIHWMHTAHDTDLTPHGSVEDQYAPKRREAILAAFQECLASYRITSPDNKIKIVVFDLDGTLWRGAAAEHDDVGPHLIEGWPLSILEAAAFLKMRGILLAIASKNDPDTARRLWNELYEKKFPLSNFVSTQFSWGPKADSIATILSETNLLAENCLFVDDNPLEREQVQMAFPDIKLISGPVSSWRRTLLWSSELQVPYITRESAGRTQSIQAVIRREAVRQEVDEEEYFRSLAVSVTVERITATDDKKFARALELLNKTNQFNSTGRRWAENELAQYFVEGGLMLAALVSDRHTDYGLTAVLLYRGGECSQLVISCRVFGLRMELALARAYLEATASAGQRSLLFRDTGKNSLCRKFIENIGVSLPAINVGGDTISVDIRAGSGRYIHTENQR